MWMQCSKEARRRCRRRASTISLNSMTMAMSGFGVQASGFGGASLRLVHVAARAAESLDLSCEAEQDADVAFLQTGAAEHVAQGVHDVVGIVTKQEPDGQEGALQVFEHLLGARRCRQCFFRLSGVRGAIGDEELVTADGYRLGQIQRRVRR